MPLTLEKLIEMEKKNRVVSSDSSVLACENLKSRDYLIWQLVLAGQSMSRRLAII